MKKKPMHPVLEHVLISISTVLGVLLLAVLFFTWQEKNKPPTQELELFYMYGDKAGAYFLEPQAEYENVIYVPRGTLDELPDFPTELGERFTGTFDSEGWELLSIKHKEDK